MKFRLITILFILLIGFSAAQESQSSMVVGVEGTSLRCSGGAELGWQVGETVELTRAGSVVGYAKIEKIGEYQTWLITEKTQGQVGDRVRKPRVVESGRNLMVKKLTFKAKLNGGGGGGLNGGDFFSLFGLYNLVDNQRFANRYGDGYYRTSANVNLAVGVTGFLLNRFRRGPRAPRARAEFEVGLDRIFKQADIAPVEINLVIFNSGEHDLNFDGLGEHIFLEDRFGEKIAFYEMSSDLLTTLAPGESVEGIVRFPRAELGSKIKIHFDDILGRSKSAKF